MSNFVNDYLNEKVSLDDIDDYIDNWHEGNSNKELHEFLGLTKEEYAIWLVKPFLLDQILEDKRKK